MTSISSRLLIRLLSDKLGRICLDILKGKFAVLFLIRVSVFPRVTPLQPLLVLLPLLIYRPSSVLIPDL